MNTSFTSEEISFLYELVYERYTCNKIPDSVHGMITNILGKLQRAEHEQDAQA